MEKQAFSRDKCGDCPRGEWLLRRGIVAVILWLGVLTAVPAFAATIQPVAPANVPYSPVQQITGTAAITPPATLSATATSTASATPSATPTVTPTIPPTITPAPAPVAITAVEPDHIPTESGGMLSVLGSGFTPGSVIRLVGYGLLDTTFINSNALRGVAPAGVPPGEYDVQVGIGDADGPSVTRKDAVRITEQPGPTNTPVPTATPTFTPTPVYIFGQPQLAIQSARTTPAALEPGQPFDLALEIANQGNWTAIDISVELQSTDVAVPVSGSNVRILPRVGVEETISTTLSLALNDDAAQGQQSIGFNLTYFDINGKSYNTQQSVGIAVGEGRPTPGAAQPRLVLTTYRVEPETLEPGGIFNLSLAVTNVGDVETRNVLLRLGGEGGAALEPFALLNSGNVRVLPELGAGETAEITQRMLVAGTADSGVYNLPVDFTYSDSSGQELQDSQVINLLVEEASLLQVGFYRPTGPGMVGQPLDLPVEVVNIGRDLVNVSRMTLSSPAGEIENNSVFVGPLDGGTSGSLDGVIVPQEGGPLEVTVTVNYLDDFNQRQTYEETLIVDVEAPPTPEAGAVGEAATAESEGGFLNTVWRVVKGLLGLGS